MPTNPSTHIALLGECMLELSPAEQSTTDYQLAIAGDTFNTAVALAQLGVDSSYCTGLGVDSHSDRIVAQACDWGIDSSSVLRLPDCLPGLYMINTDASGERSFNYWREHSAAHKALSTPELLAQLLQSAADASHLYLSGITLALCGDRGRKHLLNWLPRFRDRGGKLVYDSNYRAALWPDLASARSAHLALLAQVDIYLPGADDLDQLGGEPAELPNQQLEWVRRDGGERIDYGNTGGSGHYVPPVLSSVLDTTGAGDAFNGAYLAARLIGVSQASSVIFACRVAAGTIARRGAIMPAPLWRSFKEELDAQARRD